MKFITNLSLIISTTGIAALIFLMLQVFFAQLIIDTLIQSTSNSLLSLIIFLFFLVALISALIATSIISRDVRIFTAAVGAFFITIILIITIAYCSVINRYDVLPLYPSTTLLHEILLRGSLYLIAIPQILTIFAVYVLTPWLFFALILGVFNVVFSILLGGIQK